MPGRKKTTEEVMDIDTPVENMFSELEKDPEPTSGPASKNQPHLGGKTQKLEPEKKVANVDGTKKSVKQKLVTNLSEDNNDSSLGEEMDFYLVELYVENLKFIPGPNRKRINVLKSWCDENCVGGWKPMKNGLTWIFENEEDRNLFNAAWNSRKIEEKPDIVDEAFYA